MKKEVVIPFATIIAMFIALLTYFSWPDKSKELMKYDTRASELKVKQYDQRLAPDEEAELKELESRIAKMKADGVRDR